MLKRHLDNLLTYLEHRITNAVTEGLNSKIQGLKAAARGFRNFRNYRTRILFFCGKLDLYPLPYLKNPTLHPQISAFGTGSNYVPPPVSDGLEDRPCRLTSGLGF